VLIKTTRQVSKVIQNEKTTVQQIEVSQEVSVDANSEAQQWTPELEGAALKITSAPGIQRMEIDIAFDPKDPKAMKSAALELGALQQSLEQRAALMTPKAPPPSISLTKTGAGFTLGAVGGMGTGLLLQEMGKLGQSSGNAYLSTAAVACTLVGAALGAGVGAGVIKADVDKFGVKAKFQT